MLEGHPSRELRSSIAGTRNSQIEEPSATLGVLARVTYERRKNITELVPPDVLRARNHAWLDLISPLTEWAGLKGDEIRNRREAMRIQQEETVLKVVRLAIHRLLKEQATVRPLTSKFLLPFLEKASWEDPESDLIAWWADLLASAADTKKETHPKYIDILSTMTTADAKLINDLWLRFSKEFGEISEAEINTKLIEDFVLRSQSFPKLEPAQFDVALAELAGSFVEYYSEKGILIEDLHYPTSTGVGRSRKSGPPSDRLNLGVLISSYVLRKTELVFAVPTPFIGEFNCFVELVSISDFGRGFLEACHGRDDDKASSD